MRFLLILYVIVLLLLNFFVDHPYIFYLALSTFPVTVYLLVGKRRKKPQTMVPPSTPPEARAVKKEDSL